LTGFDADWLELRAPADAAARNPALVDRLAAWAAERRRLSILDLGCGTGATLRALAPRLDCEQHWLLVDDDPALLARCPESLGRATVATAQFDLARDLELLPWTAVDLVTCSALLDLVSANWLARMTAFAGQAALYCALTVDGRVALEPSLPDDAPVLALVAAHHRRDKSFGPALGHAAAPAAAEFLRAAGRAVELVPADWELGPERHALQAALLDGYAAAATEEAPAQASRIAAWRRARADAPNPRVRVGHRDLLSLPA
jgi:SAM-dependent methyltransferase